MVKQRDPTEFVDPAARARTTYERANTSIGMTDKRLRQMAEEALMLKAGDDESLQTLAIQQALNEAPDQSLEDLLSGQPFRERTDDEIAARATELFEQMKRGGGQQLVAKYKGLEEGVKQGAAAFTLDPDQRKAVLTSQPWSYSTPQASAKIMKKVAPDKLPQMMLNGTPADLEEVAIKTAIKQMPDASDAEIAERAGKHHQAMLAEYGWTPELVAEHAALTQPKVQQPEHDRGWTENIMSLFTAPGRMASAELLAHPLSTARQVTADIPTQVPEESLMGNAAAMIEKGVDLFQDNVTGPLGEAVAAGLNNPFSATRHLDVPQTKRSQILPAVGQGLVNFAGDITELPARALAGAGKALTSGRVAGVPTGDFVERMVTGGPTGQLQVTAPEQQTGALRWMLGPNKGTGIDSALDVGGTGPNTTYTQLGQANAKYEQDSILEALRLNPNGSDAEVAALADGILAKFIESDAAGKGVKDPVLGQIIAESVADFALPYEPLIRGAGAALRTTGRGIKGAAKAVTPLSTQQAFADGLDTVTGAFRQLEPGQQAAERIDIAGGMTGSEAGLALDRAGAQSRAVSRHAGDLEHLLKPIRALKENEKEPFYKILTNPNDEDAMATVFALDPAGAERIRKATVAAKEVERAHVRFFKEKPELFQKFGSVSWTPEEEAIIRAAKGGQDVAPQLATLDPLRRQFVETQIANPDVITPKGRLRNLPGQLLPGDITEFKMPAEGGTFVPGRLRLPTPNEVKYEASKAFVDPVASSTLRRNAGPEKFIPDVAAQWDAEIKQLAAVSGDSAALRQGVTRLRQGSAVQPIPVRGPGALNHAGIEAMREEMQRRTGGEEIVRASEVFAAVGQGKTAENMVDAISRLTFNPGEVTKGQYDFLMPKEGAAEFIKGHLLLMGGPGGRGEAEAARTAKFFGMINDYAVRPLNTVTAAGMTSLGGPMYTLNNLLYYPEMAQLVGGFEGLKLSVPALVAELTHAGAGGKSRIGQKMFTSHTGAKISTDEAIQILKDFGMYNTGDARMFEKSGRNAVGRAADKFADLAGSMSPLWVPMGEKFSQRHINRSMDNAQKIMALLYNYEGKSPQQLDRLFSMVSKHAGNYDMLGSVEKKYLRNIIMFYPWQRYVVPFIAQQALKHPDRLAMWIRGREYMDREYGKYLPTTESGERAYQRDLMVPAPARFQPKMGDNEGFKYTMMSIEDPVKQLFSLVPGIEAAMKGRVSSTGQLGKMLQWAPRMWGEIISGRDWETGEALQPLDFDYEDIAKVNHWKDSLGNNKASWLTQNLFAPASRVSKQMKSMHALWWEARHTPLTRLSAELRTEGGRAAGLVSYVFNMAAGRDAANVGPPGTVLYTGTETPITASSKKEGMSAAQRKERRLTPKGVY